MSQDEQQSRKPDQHAPHSQAEQTWTVRQTYAVKTKAALV